MKEALQPPGREKTDVPHGGAAIDWSGTVPASADAARAFAVSRAVFKCAQHLIIATRPDGVIIDMNPAAERALGWQREELVGWATPQIFHDPREVAEYAKELSDELGVECTPGFDLLVAMARRGTPREREWTHIRKDGSRFPVLLSVTAIWDDDGGLMGFVGISTDLTERKQREEAQRRAEGEAQARLVAERADKSKSRFLAAASHDLRQPLQALRLFLEALKHRLRGRGETDLLARMDEALSSSEALLNTLLSMSILEAGMVRPRMEPFDLFEFLQQQAGELRPAVEQKGLRFRLVPRHARVISDKVLLGRMLRNLVLNAARYTDRGGVLVGIRQRSGLWWIEVWDTGMGIAEDHLEAIFDAFYQVGNLERDSSKGHGLGLAVVDKTARLLGHRLEVRSRLGRGSVFALGIQPANNNDK